MLLSSWCVCVYPPLCRINNMFGWGFEYEEVTLHSNFICSVMFSQFIVRTDDGYSGSYCLTAPFLFFVLSSQLQPCELTTHFNSHHCSFFKKRNKKTQPKTQQEQHWALLNLCVICVNAVRDRKLQRLERGHFLMSCEGVGTFTSCINSLRS